CDSRLPPIAPSALLRRISQTIDTFVVTNTKCTDTCLPFSRMNAIAYAITRASTISRAYTLGCHCSSIWPAASRCLRRKRMGRAYRSRRRSRRDLLCRHRKRRLGLRCAGGGGERPRDEPRLRRRGEVAGGHESERGADLFAGE